jgi:DNA-binding NarL/FixJ family response regulator
MIRVLLADDEAMIREGLRLILDAQPDITVIGEAGTGAQALAAASRLHPDVVVMDVRMPDTDGVTATRRLLDAATWPVHVIVLTTFDLDEHVFEAMRAGASGFLLKTAPPRQLPAAIRDAHGGEVMLSSAITRRLIDRFADDPPQSTGTPPAFKALTDRELDILRHIARGLSNTEIANVLFIGESTVKTHVVRILTKLDLRDRTQAAVAAHEYGLMTRRGPESRDGR